MKYKVLGFIEGVSSIEPFRVTRERSLERMGELGLGDAVRRLRHSKMRGAPRLHGPLADRSRCLIRQPGPDVIRADGGRRGGQRRDPLGPKLDIAALTNRMPFKGVSALLATRFDICRHGFRLDLLRVLKRSPFIRRPEAHAPVAAFGFTFALDHGVVRHTINRQFGPGMHMCPA